MKNLIKHVQNVNSQNNLWNSGDTIVIGVSGGPDSMCLFDVLLKIAAKNNLSIIIAHVNYGLRGEDSVADQRLVENLALINNVTCKTLVCTDPSAKNENAWRNIRYNFFQKIAKFHNAHSIAVAHNKNDQAETLLLHLLRGSGLNGLSAMQLKTNNIIRPLLTTSKEDILNYCTQNNIKYNIDKTNATAEFTRNKIRNELMPYLEENFNKNIINILSATAKTIGNDYAFLNESIEKFWFIDKSKKIISFKERVFINMHPSKQNMTLRLMIHELLGSLTNIENGLIEEMTKTIKSTKNKHKIIETKDLKMMKIGDTVELMKIKD
jgi:tRNA(Ile)-lysidine synthase